ncbi:MAG: hypothetical protein IJ061_01285 [Lachnospiraceae bacterium]|nr:hypothetical protein [Lachnospiraceae bacterium]
MKKGHLAVLLLAAALSVGLAGCGGGSDSQGGAAAPAAETTAAAEKKDEAKAETKADANADAAADKAEAKDKTAKSAADNEFAADAGYYEIYEYEANGTKVDHDMLVTAGMGDTHLELKDDGTGTFLLFQEELDITWKPGIVTVYGTTNYTYEIDGDTMYLDMVGVHYTFKKSGDAAASGSGSGSGGSGSSSGGGAKAANASGEPYINDGTIEGTYKLYEFLGMSLQEYAEMSGETPQKAADSFQLEIRADHTGKLIMDGDETEVEITISGDKLSIGVEGESMEATLKDGLVTIDMEGAGIVLARLTDAAYEVPDKGEATVWTGIYTKLVGDDTKEEETFSLELYDDGTGIHHRDDMDFKVTWEQNGDEFTMNETFIGDPIVYTGKISDGELHLFNGDPDDDWTYEYVYTSDGSGSGSSGTSASSGNTESANAGSGSGSGGASGAPAGVPGGDGLLSEEEVQKGYVWMNKVAKDIFHTTYEELAEHFGVEGKFDKEEYSEHMKVNKRYYFWISKEDKNHFIYVNFEEDDPDGAPGVYTVSGFNSSGFSASEAEAKYLDVVKAEESEAGKAAAANAAMKDFSVDIHPWGDKETTVTVSMQVPEAGWAYDESRDKLVENEDINTFGAGFIQFKLEPEVSKFDFYKDKFENYKEIDDREIGGVTFNGRTYKNIGYEWTEYIAQLEDGKAMSIGIVRVDVSDGSMGDKILNSITFK